jgi:formylglycine-generating enzyme required for sulfatase activity
VAAVAVFTAFVVLGARGRAADPSYYLRQATWQESMLSSLAALATSGLEDGCGRFESETVRGGQPARQVKVPVSGANEMYLFVTGCPDVKWGVADWAEARLVRKDGSFEFLSQSQDFKVLLGRCERNLTLRSGLDQKLRLGDRTFDHGLNVQAESVILVPLRGQYEWFEAWTGVDAWAGTNGSVRFSVTGAKAAAQKRLFELVARDFPESGSRQQMGWEREDRIFEFDWQPGDWAALAARYARACPRVPPLMEPATSLAADVKDRASLERTRAVYYQSRRLNRALARAQAFDRDGLRLALEDLEKSFPNAYPKKYLARLAQLEQSIPTALAGAPPTTLAGFEAIAAWEAELESLKQEALLANPLLDFDRLLVIKRQPLGDPRRAQWEGFGLGEFLGLPRQSSWANGTMPNIDKWTNEIAVLSPARPQGTLTTLFKPDASRLVSDLDLHWDASKLLFSMPDRSNHWQICELTVLPALRSPGAQTPGGSAPGVGSFRQLTPSHPDVHNYSAIYLPDGRIDFVSTAPLQGVPCNASVIVGMIYQMNGDGRRIHQICFEQDHDYTPSILNNGRVLYLRWDYTDTPHVWNRLLMSMNPDGTGQMEYYGANSYWPNAIFFARAVPGHPTKVAGIVTGHHEGRIGELVIFDPARGRHETEGVVQRIPGRGQRVEPKIEDKLTEHSWPKFLHPWPLNEHYFLVACKPEPESLWGIYLVDVFDNMVLLKEEENWALLQPIPLAPRPKPPAIQDKVQPGSKEALVYMEDVSSGPGLRGVPRGTVKALRIFTYHFGYQTLAGIDHRVGADGPWEAKRVLGTVPVEADGSAFFLVPPKTPLSFQPLDAEGKAVALMRSWMTAMPGESVSCVGCHDRQSAAPAGANHRLALGRPPSPIKPWRGPARGFSFIHEVQPVLDKFCVGCHNGEPAPAGKTKPDLRRDQGGYVVYKGGQLDGQFIPGLAKKELLGKYGGVFEPSYIALRAYVRVGGLESDLNLLPPMEFHANTSELVQMLAKGHYGVQLDDEAWDRLVTWIDLNAPCHGRWSDVTKLPGNQCQRRLELRKLYGGVVETCEETLETDTDYELPKPVIPPSPPVAQTKNTNEQLRVPGWPMTPEEARAEQSRGGPITRTVELGDGVKMEFVRIPAGAFVMGDLEGEADERPLSAVNIGKTFWMARCEVSNEQFAKFDSSHESRFEDRTSWIFSEEYLGWPLNQPKQPVVRVSWNEALAFCRWLAAKLGEEVTLPTEAQWEYACRAGAATPLNYGGLDADFSKCANMGDASLRRLAADGWRPKSPALVPREARFNDGALVTIDTGHYAPNAWGLHDMHGNAAEWTRTTYRPYPYRSEDGRDALSSEGRKVVRGGSWRDRPKLCRSACRWAYPAYQQVYNVGFRVIIETGGRTIAAVP